jgi:hypothetical protein
MTLAGIRYNPEDKLPKYGYVIPYGAAGGRLIVATWLEAKRQRKTSFAYQHIC